jgi:hypothetical protein
MMMMAKDDTMAAVIKTDCERDDAKDEIERRGRCGEGNKGGREGRGNGTE